VLGVSSPETLEEATTVVVDTAGEVQLVLIKREFQ